MKKFALALALSLAGIPAMADSATDNLSGCLADNTTGKERKELARWVFVAIAAHPEIKDISKVTPEVRDTTNNKMAALVTKLMTETCALQTGLANKEGGNAIKNAFGVLGKLAMQELMSDPGVSQSTQEFTRQLDLKKFESVLH